jgi:hypothetical protein
MPSAATMAAASVDAILTAVPVPHVLSVDRSWREAAIPPASHKFLFFTQS